jgi:hypothetical protein
MKMDGKSILSSLKKVGKLIKTDDKVDLVLIGGAAGILTKEFPSDRVTTDCDIINLVPIESLEDIEKAAKVVAKENSLQEGWLNAKAMSLNVLPDGWDSRKIEITTFDNLRVFSLSRIDLIATKFYGGSARDRMDILSMNPNPDELTYAKNYLFFMKVPSRKANLDYIERGLRFLETLES